MQSLKGQLLIAAAELLDPNFAQTVTLLVQHDEHGALGLVLNRPGDMSVHQAWSQWLESQNACNHPLHEGGPCEGILMVLHDCESASEIEVVEGVHFSADATHVHWLLENHQGKLSCYSGYAGWSPGQLEEEMQSGSWLLMPASPELIYGADSDLWHRLSRRIASAQVFPMLNPRLIPDDPSLN